MPTPSTWAIGVAAPSGIDPYQLSEQATALPGRKGGANSLTFGSAGGEVIPPNRRISGHWTEIVDWKESPAIWVLLALLAIGVLHIKVGAGGKASAGVTV